MKKIMKKVMSLALVMIMMLSLIPMTAFAEESVVTENVETLEFSGTEIYKDLSFEENGDAYVAQVVAPADGKITVMVASYLAGYEAEVGHILTVSTEDEQGEPVIGAGYSEQQVLYVEEGDVITIETSTYDDENVIAGIMEFYVNFYAYGHPENPEVVKQMGDYAADIEADGIPHNYKWIATESGELTLTIKNDECTAGWTYQMSNYTSEDYQPSRYYWQEDAVSQTIVVTAGDEVQFNVWTCDEADEWAVPAGKIAFTLTFVPGDNSDGDGNGDGNGEGDEPVLGTTDNPYQAMAGDMKPLRVYLTAGGCAVIQASDANGKVDFVCETSSEWYVKYGKTPVYPTVDGADISVALELQGHDIFTVYNTGSEDTVVYVRVSAGSSASTDTTGTMDDPEELELEVKPGGVLGANIEQEIVAGANPYYYQWIATADGELTFTMNGAYGSQYNDLGWFYSMSNYTAYKYGDTHWSDSDEVITTETVKVSEGDVIELVVSTYNPENMWSAPAGTVVGTLVFVEKEDETEDDSTKDYVTPESGDGKDETPFVIKKLGLYLAPKSDVNTYYKWVATDNGVLTITISDEDAALYKAAYVYSIADESVEHEFETAKNVNEVKKGDVVIITTYSGSTTLEFDVAFEAGAKLEKEEPTEKPATNANDEQDYDEIVTGKVELDTTVVTTLFVLSPDKVGKYTITAPTGVKVEDWNIPSNPMNRTTNATNTVTFNCTDVGQTFLVGITAVETVDKVDVKVEFTAVAQKEEVDWTIYKNTATINKFTTVLSGLEYVNLEDEVVDKAVLGKDGFYHLNSVNGPILYVDLDDELMSLYGAADLGQLVEYVKENGEVVARYDFNDAVKEYYAAANKDGFYPLTTDLVTVLQRVGAYKEWYGEKGFLGFTEEDAWMFACYYEADAEDGSNEADSEAVVVVPLPTPEAGKEDADVVVDKDYLDEHIQQAIKDDVALELPTSNENVTMTFDPNELADADEIELNLTVNVVDDAKDETVAKNDKITDKNFVLKVEFSHEGKLPGEAVISIKVPAAIAEKYEKLFYYQIMADGSLKFVCDAPVVDGVAKVTQDHCSDYVLLTEKLVEVPATGDSTNVALWFAILALGALAIAGSVVMRKKEF